MQTQTLKDAHYRTLGFIETASNGKQTGKDSHFRTVGFYDPRTNVTQDAHFRSVGVGNMLASLITCG
jgi:hypothetical protein